jgi:broad specificity phosphatase PhoE
MVQIILLRPAKTDYDHQARIQGILDIPLSDAGRQEAAQTADKLQVYIPKVIYTSPCRSAEETTEIIGQKLGLKPKTIDRLQNVNLGLWQGLLVEEVRLKQPKIYKQWQDRPETIQPPEGEMLAAALQRACEAIEKIVRKHRSGTIAMVVPEPLASLIQHRFQGVEWADLWRGAGGCCRIEALNVDKDSFTSPPPVNGKAAVNGSESGSAVAVENRFHGPADATLNGHHPTLVYRGAKVKQP